MSPNGSNPRGNSLRVLNPDNAEVVFSTRGLEAGQGAEIRLRSVDLDILSGGITAIIGPSGCGKSTFIRCLNRMQEMEPDFWVKGQVRLMGEDIYGPGVDPVRLRRRVGYIFHRPNPFPGLSVKENVLAGLKLTGTYKRSEARRAVQEALERVGLSEEIGDDPGEISPESLTLGQRQRLCIARALAIGPEVLLMDEPCAILDPIATSRVEEVLFSLKEQLPIILVTHSLHQAARLAERTAFFLEGQVVEYGPTDTLLTSPSDPRTEDFITGKSA